MTIDKKITKLISGTFQGSGRGFGFLVPEDGKSREDDWFIPPGATGGAWHGDSVVAEPDQVQSGEGKRTAKVVKVTQRANRIVTGTVRRHDRALWLEPDSSKLSESIKLTGRHTAVRAGEKAAAQIQSFGTGGRPPMGTIRETFGRAGSREAGVAAILYQHEIDPEFPQIVLEEADRAPQVVPEEAMAGRLDLRDRTVITIDGASSKDLDDAISLEKDEVGDWVLGVHIADVSYYVAEKSALDTEAWERGTSIYFADRVVPMLPVALSNGICSLNPGVDRLTLSCMMAMGKDGAVKSHSVHKSVIRSTERMTYEDCNVLLGKGDSGLEMRYADILPMLKDMAVLARVLEKARKLRGSLNLDTSESYVVCDEAGRPVDIKLRKQGVSESLIESFMLSANECVAKHLFDLSKPAVYRVHEKPSPDKIEGLKTMLEPFGYSLLETDSFALQKILDDAKDKPEAPIISTMILRSLMKARYDVQNLGHFGLAAKYYCHFTSPIRRYPDLMVHRILTRVIEDGEREKKAPWEKKMAVLAQKAAAQSSEREIAAQSAEREIEKLYMAEYMQDHLDEVFPGAVSGVVKHGLFVVLANGVEGFVPVPSLPPDRYHYDEGRMALRGERSENLFTFGMGLKVVCIAADPGTGQIEFRLEGYEEGAPAPKVQAVDHRRMPSGRKGKRSSSSVKGRIPAPKEGKRRKKR
jgi:ribonuclease R